MVSDQIDEVNKRRTSSTNKQPVPLKRGDNHLTYHEVFRMNEEFDEYIQDEFEDRRNQMMVNFRQEKKVKRKISPARDLNKGLPADTIETQFHVMRIIKDDPFVWDGSCLGVINNENIEAQMKFMDLEYWKIKLFGHTQICMVRPATTSCPCISDELKILFGLSKIGTHRVRYHNKIYILFKPRIGRSKEIIRETSISNINFTNNTSFISQVQDIYLFRDVLGLTKTNDNSVVIRWPDQSYIPPYPISFYENKIRPHDTKTIVPGTVTKKWFGDCTLKDAARRIFRIKKISDVSTRLVYIQEQLNVIIERVDRDAVWMIALIMGRITKRLLFGLNDKIKITPEWSWDLSKVVC